MKATKKHHVGLCHLWFVGNYTSYLIIELTRYLEDQIDHIPPLLFKRPPALIFRGPADIARNSSINSIVPPTVTLPNPTMFP